MQTQPPTRPRRSPVAAVFTDGEGELRGTLIVAVVAAALVAIAISGTVAAMFGGIVGPDALAYWVLGIFLGIKLPLLALIWWVLGRGRESGAVGGWKSRECHEILAYLEREARASLARSDAASRLEYFCREAWFVAGTAADADADAAAATARRIEALASEAGVDTERARAEAMASGAAPRG